MLLDVRKLATGIHSYSVTENKVYPSLGPLGM